MSLQLYREQILNIFGITNTMTYSLQEPKIVVWDQLDGLVREWWREYQAWERQDRLGLAYHEQRLTVKGAELASKEQDNVLSTVEWDNQQGAFSAEKKTFEKPRPPVKPIAAKYQAAVPPTYYPISRGVQGVMAHFDPRAFVPVMGPSKKTELGLHDLSVGLMCPGKNISEQQYKDVKDNQIYFVFMPLSHPGDQAVFQNINRLAKAYKTGEHAKFYDFVRQIRSQMTRVKLAAEHDMGTTIVSIGRTDKDRPKFRLRPADKTSVSILDKIPQVGTEEFKNMAKELGVTEEQLANRRRIGHDTAFQNINIKKGDKGEKTMEGIAVTPGILEARRTAALNFQSLLLKIYGYGELVVAFRKHAGQFPKLAKFDSKRNVWKVGELVEGNRWRFKNPEETFPDQPLREN
jgi:hypothetical protein